ncbi:hypothetical protein F4604DRAFT_1923061 [Suillus subluteus]|nr:hypothetical protein F4604DRAFT_1923061 [Suillus subluteus]
MPFSTDGVYTIRNVGRALMLDLTDDSTKEGNPIQGYADNGTEAQKWVIKKQEEPRNSENTFTVQTSNVGYNGNGFFCCCEAVLGSLSDPRILVLSIPSDEDSAVRLANFNAADTYQQWALIRVGDLQSVGN